MRKKLLAALGASLVTGAMLGADAKLPADLLEFLGSIDSEDPEWHDYLERTDVTKLPKPPVAPALPDKRKPEAKP